MTEKIFYGENDQVFEAVGDKLEEILAHQKKIQEAELEFKAQQKAREAARESALAKLAALGLTEAEIAAL
jgi:hypothetical protein